MTKQQTNFIQVSSQRDALPAEHGDRRFFVVDPVKLVNAQLHATALQAHADHLQRYQRASGVRVRLCTTGCYSMYDAQGRFIGRSAPANGLAGIPAGLLKTTAARMAYSEDLADVCRQADLDFESTGAVSPTTVASIRKLLSDIGAA